jgi:hypothetical protein
MNEQSQVDANKVIESLLRQVAEYAQKVALLEAYTAGQQPAVEEWQDE